MTKSMCENYLMDRNKCRVFEPRTATGTNIHNIPANDTCPITVAINAIARQALYFEFITASKLKREEMISLAIINKYFNTIITWSESMLLAQTCMVLQYSLHDHLLQCS